jgi:hypothetical protein
MVHEDTHTVITAVTAMDGEAAGAKYIYTISIVFDTGMMSTCPQTSPPWYGGTVGPVLSPCVLICFAEILTAWTDVFCGLPMLLRLLRASPGLFTAPDLLTSTPAPFATGLLLTS